MAERPLHVTEEGHHRGSEEEPAHEKRSRISPTKRIPLINNWICDRSISGVRTHLQSQCIKAEAGGSELARDLLANALAGAGDQCS